MPIIWEAIMRNISGLDVANCMKVSRAMRSVIGQCLDSSCRLRQEMNVAATVSAVKAGKMQSTVEVEFKRKKKPYYDYRGQAFYAIDNMWFYSQEDTCDIKVIALGQNNEVVFKKSLRRIRRLLNDSITVYPCRDAKRYFVNNNGTSDLIKVKSRRAKLVSKTDSEVYTDWGCLVLENGCGYLDKGCLEVPCCVSYKLYQGVNEEADSRGYFMMLLDPKGIRRDITLLHKRVLDFHSDVCHATSREQVEFITNTIITIIFRSLFSLSPTQ